jgi:uncharacterized membrane protein (DUF106 family)
MIDISAIPTATVLIMLISATISFINMGLNRLLISHMIGWQEYKGMRKETSEYNSRRMAALRANDTKTLEKLKKKEKQIMNMQTKMMKPQMLLLLFTVVYFIIWPILSGYFPDSVAVVPGFGEVPFFIWYLICAFFFGTLAGKVVGITPIQ